MSVTRSFVRYTAVLLVGIFFLSASGLQAAPMPSVFDLTQPITAPYLPGQVIVKFKQHRTDIAKADGLAKARRFASAKRGRVRNFLKGNNSIVLTIADGASVPNTIAALAFDPDVAYAEPVYPRSSSAITSNDPRRAELWGLDNTGQTVQGVAGTIDADVDALEAFTLSEGATSTVIVAVIDTGVAYNHPDLQNQLWDGTNCVTENGAPLGNCLHGYDFEDGDRNPLPTSDSHGTHIAGIIAAEKNNGVGILGIAPHAKIMALKFGFDTATEVQAIDFAIQNGAKVINASYGGPSYSQAEFEAIERFRASGGIFVAAAGNDAGDNDAGGGHNYPSDYTSSAIVGVAATDAHDALANFSSFGATSIDVGAPGVNILSAIADTTPFSETFQTVASPAVPVGWTATGDWGTRDSSGSIRLFGDAANIPYVSSTNTTITSPMINLSTTTQAQIDFLSWCDTVYSPSPQSGGDYMSLEMTGDGSTYTELGRWNEATYDNDADSTNTPPVVELYANLASSVLTTQTRFRFRWVTSGSDSPARGYEGCYVDNITITGISDGSDERYDYYSGTSMASPQVAGLAALLWGYNARLTGPQVKEILLASGDTLSVLTSKTTSGKRVNAHTALQTFQPIVGYSSDNVIPASQVVPANDGTGLVAIDFKLKDGISGLPVTLGEFGYSIDEGATWLAPANGDASTALTSSWREGTYLTALDYTSTTYRFTFDTTHADVAELEATSTTLRVRFQAFDGAVTSTFAVSEAVVINNVPPPTIMGLTNDTAPSRLKVWEWSSNDASATYRYLVDQSATGTPSGGYTSATTTTQDGGNGIYYMHIQARNEVGSESTVTTVSAVLDTTPPVITLIRGDQSIYEGTAYVDPGAIATDLQDGSRTAQIIATSTVDVLTAGSYSVRYAVSDTAGNTAFEVSRTVTVLPIIARSISLTLQTTASTNTNSILIGSNAPTSSIVSIPVEVSNGQLDLSAVLTGTLTKQATLTGELAVHASTTIGDVIVGFPAGITVTSQDPSWTGVIQTPQVRSNSSVTVIPDTDKTATVSAVIEIGAEDIPLTFDLPVRIFIRGKADAYVGYVQAGTFGRVRRICTSDTLLSVSAELVGGATDCKMNSGSDLVIWTRHFTKFVTYAQEDIPAPAPSVASGGGGGGGGGQSLPSPTTNVPAVVVSPTSTPFVSGPTFSATSSPPAGENLLRPRTPTFLFPLVRDTALEASSLARVRASFQEFHVASSTEVEEVAINFVVYGISASTKALGSGERLALVRDQLETLGRINLGALQDLTDGKIPQERNLPNEQRRVNQVLSVFRQLTGASVPDFKKASHNLTWNTLMYRLRFPREVPRERVGITKYQTILKRIPKTPFDWAAVRALGYVLLK